MMKKIFDNELVIIPLGITLLVMFVLTGYCLAYNYFCNKINGKYSYIEKNKKDGDVIIYYKDKYYIVSMEDVEVINDIK